MSTFNPGTNPKLGKLGCGKMLVSVDEKDSLKDKGWYTGIMVRCRGRVDGVCWRFGSKGGVARVWVMGYSIVL